MDGFLTLQKTIVVFDSDCILCSHWVRFVLRHDPTKSIQFASSRKPVGQRLATDFGISPEDLDLTYLVIQNGEALIKSDATIALLADLRPPWSWLRALRFLPKTLRDAGYDVIARNRLRWFGEQKDCFLPTPDQRSRFLD